MPLHLGFHLKHIIMTTLKRPFYSCEVLIEGFYNHIRNSLNALYTVNALWEKQLKRRRAKF